MERELALSNGGSLRFREEEGRVIFESVCPDDKRGLYKLRLYGRSRGLELGTLMPEKGALRLRRSMSVEKLKTAGCWPVIDAEVVLAVPFGGTDTPPGWTRQEKPAQLLQRDPVLAEAARELEYGLVRRGKDTFQLALPFGENRPLALTPLFCLARIERLGGKWYTVYSFREDGTPVLPPRC